MELSYNNNNRFSSSSSSMTNIDHAVWDQVTSKFIQTIKRLEDKIEIDRKNLLSFKKEQHRHNLKLSNNNKKLREEKQMMGEQAMELQNTTKILTKRVEELEQKVTELVSSEQLSIGKLHVAEKKLQNYTKMENSVKELRKELFYWEQHHTEHLNATLSAVLEHKDKIHNNLLKRATLSEDQKKMEQEKYLLNLIRNDSRNSDINNNTSQNNDNNAGSRSNIGNNNSSRNSNNIKSNASPLNINDKDDNEDRNTLVNNVNKHKNINNEIFAFQAELEYKNERIVFLENQVEELKLLLDKTRKSESKKYELLERKYLSAKGINVALERQLMFRNQQVELRKTSQRLTM
jgi:hypothetical protein